MIAAIVDELAPELIKRNAVGSSRRRDHSRRPLTPPYMRLRIRRFMLTLEVIRKINDWPSNRVHELLP